MSKLISYYFKRDKWILLAMVALSLPGGFLLGGYTGEESTVGGVAIFVGFTAFFIGVSILPLWLCIRDYKRMYGSYGSFFAALPLTGKEAMGGRGLWFIIVVVVACLCSLAYFGPIIFRSVREEMEICRFFASLFEQPNVNYLTGFAFMVIAGMLLAAAVWVFVTSVGSEKPFRRFGIGGPIMLYVGVQIAMNVVVSTVMNVMGSQRVFINEELMVQEVAGLFFRTSLVLSGLMLIAAVVLFLRSVHSHDKKLSVS